MWCLYIVRVEVSFTMDQKRCGVYILYELVVCVGYESKISTVGIRRGKMVCGNIVVTLGCH